MRDDSEAALLRAHALDDLGRPADGLAVVRHALAADPHNCDLLETLASLLVTIGDPAAVDAAAAAVDAAPGQPYPLILLSAAQRARGDRAAALETARRALDAEPQSTGAMAHLALCLAAERFAPAAGREARELIDRAIGIEPDDVSLRHVAAYVYGNRGSRSVADEHLAAGLALAPDDADLLMLDAAAEPFQGPAVAKLRALLALSPTHTDALRKLAALMWNALARLGSGVWVFAVAFLLVAHFAPASFLRATAFALFAPIPLLWTRVFVTMRRRLPRGYLRRALAWRPEAWLALALFVVGGVLVYLLVRLMALDRTPQRHIGVIVGVAIIGAGHFLLQLARLRGRRSETDAVDLSVDRDAAALMWGGFGVAAVLVQWATRRWSADEHALYAVAGCCGVIVAVFALESTATWTVALLRRQVGFRQFFVAHRLPALLLLGGGAAAWWAVERIAA